MKKFIIPILLIITAVAANIDRVYLETDLPLSIPNGWTKLNRYTGEKPFTLNIAIKHQNVDVVRKIWKAVSNPKSPEYGDHLTLDELNKIWSPSEEAIETVRSWLHKYGITNEEMKWNRGGEYVQVTIGADLIEEMLGLEYYTFAHEDGRTHITSLGPYSVPKAVSEHLDMITGMTRFHTYKRGSRFANRQYGDDIQYSTKGQITPDVIREQYNISTASITNPNSSHAVSNLIIIIIILNL